MQRVSMTPWGANGITAHTPPWNWVTLHHLAGDSCTTLSHPFREGACWSVNPISTHGNDHPKQMSESFLS
jgi:hypothetical protein